jgi:glucosamine kinase
MANVRDTLLTLVAEAGLSCGQISDASIHLGLAGVMGPEKVERVADAVRSFLPAGRITVSDDRVTTLIGALGGQDGAVAAIGTGSFLGRSAAGSTHLIGGWGFSLGDNASGAWLGSRLLRALVLAVDGIGPQTPFMREVLADYGNDPIALVAFASTAQPADFATLAPRIIAAAANGDTVAKHLMRSGADYIANGLRALGWTPAEPLCLTGGIGPHYANWVVPEAAAAVVPAKGTALDGAMTLAAQRSVAP